MMALTTTPALAHPGHGSGGTAAGLLHPLSGFDHLLAMTAVGVWAAQRGGRLTWLLPTAFLAGMTLGGVLSSAGVPLRGVETGILLSVLGLGSAIALGLRPAAAAALGGVAIFALFHGYAHVQEMPAGGSLAGYQAGFLLATGLLHAAGVATAVVFKAALGRPLVRMTGGAIVACGMLLIVGLV